MVNEQFPNKSRSQLLGATRFDTSKYNLSVESQADVSMNFTNDITYIDEVMEYVQERRKGFNLAKILFAFLQSEHYDTDALLQDIGIDESCTHSNLQKISDEHSELCVCQCICGENLRVITGRECYDGIGVWCDSCELNIGMDKDVYHCPNDENDIHKDGYDVCTQCVGALFGEEKLFDIVRYYAQRTRC